MNSSVLSILSRPSTESSEVSSEMQNISQRLMLVIYMFRSVAKITALDVTKIRSN